MEIIYSEDILECVAIMFKVKSLHVRLLRIAG